MTRLGGSRRGPILFALFIVAVVAASTGLVVVVTSGDEAPRPASAALSTSAGAPNGVSDADPDRAGGATGDAGGGSEPIPSDSSVGGAQPPQGQPPPGAEASGEPTPPQPLGKQPPQGTVADESATTKPAPIEPQPPQEHPDASGPPTQLPPDEPPGLASTKDRGKPGVDGSDEPPGE